VQITEVRIKLCEENNERLLAFCSITFDNAFVVRDLKIIEGTRGMFVAMPSRKLTDRCHTCGCKNHLRARFCNQCGHKLDESRALRAVEGRAKLHADIAHPIHSAAREMIQASVARAYAEERERAKLPGYICRYDEFDYEMEDVPVSYGAMVQEMQRPGYRSHAPHASPARGPHMAAQTQGETAKAAAEEGFGAGIM
jgi:stage V sporulation protein G